MPKLLKDSRIPKTRWLNIEDFEYLCFNLAREKLSAVNDPIPDYSTRNTAYLESSLALPKQTFDGKLLYPTLDRQSAVLFYFLIKNHPFQNGNKRIAVMSLLVFLGLNNKWINIKPLDLYKVAIMVSESDPAVREELINSLAETIEYNAEDL